MKMKVSALKCNNCNTIIYSRARHDMRSCPCWKNELDNPGIAVDGGFDYWKVSAGTNSNYESLPQYDIGEISKSTLYNDWNLETNKYGLISDASPTET